MNAVVDKNHQEQSGRLREVLATYQEAEDLINIGAYKKGSNQKIDFALAHIEAVTSFLRQRVHEAVDLPTTIAQLQELKL
jgi:flagellum-specific ATP synthase